jgi:hypothetical protein
MDGSGATKLNLNCLLLRSSSKPQPDEHFELPLSNHHHILKSFASFAACLHKHFLEGHHKELQRRVYYYRLLALYSSSRVARQLAPDG